MAGAFGGANAGLSGDDGFAARAAAGLDYTDSPFESVGPDMGFAGQYIERTIGEALVADLRAAPLVLREKVAFARSRTPRIMVHAVVDGRAVYHNGRGEQSALKPGCLIIRRADDTAVIRSERFARVVTVAVALHLLVPRYATAEALDDYVVHADNALPQRLLYSFIVGLVDTDGASGLNPQMTIIDALGGMVSMILAQLPPPPAQLSELAATRAADLLRYLRRNFANPHLTPSMMAEDLHISVRYAHRLMQLTGRSFRDELVRLRLEAARLAFAADRRPRQTIADIAISVGFNDLSQFNRHFRTAFAMTPRAARRLDEANGYQTAGDDQTAWEARIPRRTAGGAPVMAAAAPSRPL